MSVWKSPILYVGIALVLSLVGLLSAPFIVDWNSYRASVEDYGRKLTGREVVISGDISARLFPWPRLRLEGVRIANPAGAAIPDLVKAEAIEARMLLGSLIGGHVEVSDIRVEKPVFALERLETGEASWWLRPQLKGGIPIGAERISVEDLEIVDGQIFLSDSRRGGTARFDDFDAVLSSQTLLGPWKARGQLRHNDQVLSVGVSTGKHKAGDPFKFGIKLTPVEGPGLVYSFDGEYSAKGVTPVSGTLWVEPFVDEDGKADSQAQLRAVTLKARLSFKEDHALLQEIEIAPADREHPGNLLTGNAAIELQSRISLMADLKAPKFDLDGILGQEGRKHLKSGTVLQGLSQFIELMPEGVDGRLILNVGTLTAGGETMEGARLEAELADRGLIIHQLSATLPGQTKAKFSGLLFASSEKPQLAGDLEIEAANTRELVSWLAPEWKAAIAEHWSGARGKLSLRSKVDYGPLSLRLTDSRIVLDDSTATGEVLLTGSDQARHDIRLRVDRLDLDRYLPQGLGVPNIPGETLARLAGLAGGVGALGDVQLTLQAGSVVLNGAEAHDVATDVVARENILEVRSIGIGKIGDAKLEISGTLEPRNGSNVGSATIRVDAEDPQPLLHWLGVIAPRKAGEPEPSWAGELRPLNATLSAHVNSGKAESEVRVGLKGRAGGSNVSFDSTYLGDLSDPTAGRLTLTGDVTSPSAKQLAAFIGMTGQSDERDAARFMLRLDGEVRSGLQVQTELQALGAKANFAGSVEGLFSKASEVLAEGAITLSAQNGDMVLQTLGIPSPQPGASLNLSSNVAVRADHVELANLKASAGEQRFEGRFTFGGGTIDAAAQAAELSVPWLLSLALLPTDGRPINDVTLFAESFLKGVKGKVAVDAERLTLVSGLQLNNGRAELTAGDGKLQVSVAGSGPRGTPFALRGDLARQASELHLKASIEGGLDLRDILSAPDGEPVIDSLMTFKSNLAGAGRSPAGLAASLSGGGTMNMPNGFVRGIDAQSFISGLRFSPTSAGLDRLLRRGFTGSDLIFSGGAGSVTISDGTATFGPVRIEAGGIRGSIKTIVELTSGKVDLGVEVGLASLGDVPPVEVAYSGPPRRLERSVDASELKARLSSVEIRKNMEELEKLQREQMELFAEDDQMKGAADRHAEAEALQLRSRASRQRAEEAAVLAKANERARALEFELQLERQALDRRAEVIEQRRRVLDEQRRALESALDRQELQRRAEAAERRRQSELAAKEQERQRLAEEAERQRLADEAARKAEEERKAQEAALELERQRLAEEAARKAEEERKAQEAALELERQRQAEEAERQRLAEEAARKAEEERKAQEAALELERQRQAEEAERQRLAEEAARKAEEERKAQEAALELERQRLAEEAAQRAEEEKKAREAAIRLEEELKRKAEEEELQRRAEEAKRQAEEERKAQEAALEVERQRQAEEAERQRLAEEAAQRAEEEKKAREAAIRLEEELKRKAEEEELQRRAEEAKKQAEDKRRAQQAALELERQRQEEEAEQQRQAELQRTRNLALQKMSGRELEQHLQRMAAWKTTSQRARELAAKRALEEAKAKIDKLLEESSNSAAGKLLQGEAGEQGAIPITAPGDGLATESITTSASERSSPELPAAEPLPIEAEDAMEGPTSIDPSSATGSIPAKQTQLGTSPDGSLADGELDSEIEPSFLQRLERLIKAPPSNRRDPVLKKKYNFNR